MLCRATRPIGAGEEIRDSYFAPSCSPVFVCEGLKRRGWRPRLPMCGGAGLRMIFAAFVLTIQQKRLCCLYVFWLQYLAVGTASMDSGGTTMAV